MNAGQLKSSILQMAVQGKLVPQDPNDEPASVLLEKIRAEKQKLVKTGKIKKDKNESVIFRGSDNLPYPAQDAGRFYERTADGRVRDITAQLPFEIPASWEWVRLGGIGIFIRGHGIKRSDIQSTGIRAIRYGEIYTTYDTAVNRAVSFVSEKLAVQSKQLNFGDLLLTLTGESKEEIAKTVAFLSDERTVIGGDLAMFTNHKQNSLFLAYILNSPFAIQQKTLLGAGDIIVHISCDKLASILIPIPPLAEQHRIVARIEELLPHIANYDAAEQKLTALNAAFPEQLKKSILQAAVQGKLVPQDPADEPASVLLERIRAEKAALVKAGKIKRDKYESVIFRRDNSHYEKLNGAERCIDGEIPFAIPESWAWARLGSIGTFIRGNGIKRSETRGAGVNAIRYGEIYTTFDIAMTHAVSFVSEELAKKSKTVGFGDLLFTLTGENKEEIGKTVAFMGIERTVIGGDLAIFTNHGQNPMFMSYLLNSPYAIQQKAQRGTGDIIVHISCDKLSSILIPIPPSMMQQMIVEQVEKLMETAQNIYQ